MGFGMALESISKLLQCRKCNNLDFAPVAKVGNTMKTRKSATNEQSPKHNHTKLLNIMISCKFFGLEVRWAQFRAPSSKPEKSSAVNNGTHAPTKASCSSVGYGMDNVTQFSLVR